MEKVLWFSRHKMSAAQFAALKAAYGDITITQLSGSPQNVHTSFEAEPIEKGNGVSADKEYEGTVLPLKTIVGNYDVIAAVLPIGLMQQLLPFCPNDGILQSVMDRKVDEFGVAQMTFQKWQRVIKIKVVVENL